MSRVCGCYRGGIVVMDMFYINMISGKEICSELGKGATSEAGKSLFRAANV